MADQLQPEQQQSSDEIDLGQLIELIKKLLRNVGNFLLRVFLYFKRNMLKLVGLMLVGLAISVALSQIISKKLKTDVIVRPNFESKNYLFDVVDEIEANIKVKNDIFFDAIDISIEDLQGFHVEIAAIEDTEVETDASASVDMQYLEVLRNFKDESFVVDILRSELSEKSVVDYKIVFIYKDASKGPQVVKKLVDYINKNEYFDGLKEVYTSNAKSRIEKNTVVINQIDQLVDNFSKALLAEKQKSDGMVYMEKENNLNIPGLLNLKDKLSNEIEEKRLEIVQQTGVLRILNFGKTKTVKKEFFSQTHVLIPSVLVLAFLAFSFLQYVNRKSKEIE